MRTVVPPRRAWLIPMALLALSLPVMGQTPPPEKISDKERCEKLMQGQVAAPKQSVFDADTFPVIDFPNHDLIVAALGMYTLKIRYFDAAYNEVEKPIAPGRYGARVELNFPSGYADTFHVTLFKTPKPYRPFRVGDRYKVDAQLPEAWGISEETQQSETWNTRDLFFSLTGHGTHHTNRPAMLAAAMADIQKDPARWHGVWWIDIDVAWWNGLEAKLGNLPPDYERIVTLPEGYENHPDQRWPVILSLHGRTGGDTMERLKGQGALGYVLGGHTLPCIVVTPRTLAPDGWEPDKLARLLDQVEAQYRVDAKRIYITGGSMGGLGAIKFAIAFPQRVAAMAPVAGGGDADGAERLKTVPTWFFHGAEDFTVPPCYSTDLADRMKAVGAAEVKLTLVPGADHGNLGNYFWEPELYNWLFQHKLP